MLASSSSDEDLPSEGRPMPRGGPGQVLTGNSGVDNRIRTLRSRIGGANGRNDSIDGTDPLHRRPGLHTQRSLLLERESGAAPLRTVSGRGVSAGSRSSLRSNESGAIFDNSPRSRSVYAGLILSFFLFAIISEVIRLLVMRIMVVIAFLSDRNHRNIVFNDRNHDSVKPHYVLPCYVSQCFSVNHYLQSY